MKVIKKMLGCLLVGIVINNCTTLSLAEVILDRYENFNASSIIVNDNTLFNPIDVEIEGNTLVSPMKNPSFTNHTKTNMIKMNNGRVVNNSSTGTSSDNNYYMVRYDTGEFLTLKNETQYTVFISGKVDFAEPDATHRIVPFYRSDESGSPKTRIIKDITILNNAYP